IVVLKDKIPGRAHRQATGATDTPLDENGADSACDRQRVPAVVNVAEVQLVAGGSGSSDRSISGEHKIDKKISCPGRPAGVDAAGYHAVASKGISATRNGNGVEPGTSREVVGGAQLGRTCREDEIVARHRRDIADPV